MASLVAKLVAKKIFQESAENKQGREDPYFETIPATRLGIKTTKKRRRALPPGLTPQEEKVLTKVKRRAYRLDLSLFTLCGLRFGWGSVIGLIPFIGDFADMLLAVMVYRTACSVEPSLKANTKMKMQMNIIVDFLVGLIPFVGDVVDAAYKCNTKNAILLEDELRERGKKRARQSGLPVQADPSLPDEYDYQDERDIRQERGDPPRYSSRRDPQRNGRRDQDLEIGRGEVAPPRPARTR